MASFPRASGVLLHPTSLPSPYGIGDLGQPAYDFIDRLAQSGQTYWQVLPLGPTAFGDSPYQCLSSFAGNTNLISLDSLAAHGWLTQDELADRPPFRSRVVEFDKVTAWHDEMLTRAYDRFSMAAGDPEFERYQAWCSQPSVQWWLEDFVLFAALKEKNHLVSWVRWPKGEALSSERALEAARDSLRYRINEHRFRQWAFFDQWTALKSYAHKHGIQIIGDLPFYVGHDSADVWTNPEMFDLDEEGNLNTIAGVPPDSFSRTGQRWGNPIYLWDRHRHDHYAWWIRRIDAALGMFDLLRIDHFRAFHDYWRIPADEPTAVNGEWFPGPDKEFFDALGPERNRCIIAEDLGDKMEEPMKLRDEVGLPGMIVLQFAFSGNEEDRARFIRDRDEVNRVVYTGTHDNNTIRGWWQSEASGEVREAFLQETAAYAVKEPQWAMITYGMDAYAAHTFITPMQDIIGLGGIARMNRPSIEAGNWRWRAASVELFEETGWDRLKAITHQTKRTRHRRSKA